MLLLPWTSHAWTEEIPWNKKKIASVNGSFWPRKQTMYASHLLPRFGCRDISSWLREAWGVGGTRRRRSGAAAGQRWFDPRSLQGSSATAAFARGPPPPWSTPPCSGSSFTLGCSRSSPSTPGAGQPRSVQNCGHFFWKNRSSCYTNKMGFHSWTG
jgi:hypothetical protein